MQDDTLFHYTMQVSGTERQAALIALKQGEAQRVVLPVTQGVLQASLEEEVTAQLGPYRRQRTDVQTAWHCRVCGSRTQRDLRRNGHYRRQLTVAEGTIELKVPEIRCVCQGYADVTWETFGARQRYWYDVQRLEVYRYLNGSSYRLVSDSMSAGAGVNISHVAAWRAMQLVGQDVGRAVQEEDTWTGCLTDVGSWWLARDIACPRVIVLDEVYVSVWGEDFVFLLAVAEDGRVLAIDGPTTKEAENWQRLLDTLTQQGISPEAGLVGVVSDGDSAIAAALAMVWPQVAIQRCVWHILKQVREEAAAVYGVQAQKTKQIVQEARRIFYHDPMDATAMEQATDCLLAFHRAYAGTAWGELALRAFRDGTTYLRVPGLPRTNGQAERAIKEFRRRTKVMDGFKSREAAGHFAATWAGWNNERWRIVHQRQRLRRPRNLKIPPPHPKLP